MKSLRIVTIALLVFAWTVNVPAKAQAPTMLNMEVFALHHPKNYAQIMVYEKGWTKKDYACLNKIWTKESHWNYKAKNNSSSAYGIWQGLTETSKSPAVQIRNGLRYISNRYGNPCSAWNYWQRHYWY